MNMHVIPVHKQYIKDFSVLLALHDPSVIKHRKIRTVRFSEMEVDIVILIAIIDLFPDTRLDLLLFVFPDQVAEAFLCELKEFIHVFISGHMKELMVCIKEFILRSVCFVDDKCAGKVFRDILKCESQLLADS